VPELIDASVGLLRQHYLELVTANALFTIPMLLFSLTSVFYMSDLTPGSGVLTPASPGSLSGFFVIGALVAVISLALSTIAQATTVVIVSDNYLGTQVTIGNAVRRALERFWTVLGAGLLQGLAVFLGVICFIIPGFFCIAWYFAVVNVVMVEGKGASDALRRSHELARGSVGRILGTLFLTGLVLAIVEGLIQAVIGALIGFGHPNPAINNIVGTVVNVLCFPFFTVMSTLLYYDLRIRKEGLDLQLMAKELGTPVPPPASA
jgi:hypothetical protein